LTGAAASRRSRMSPRSCASSGRQWKELDKQYMRAQLARAGKPGPRVIGIDEIAIRKGHT